MTEDREVPKKCGNCPNRGRMARLLAHATRQNEVAEGCEGLVRVSHCEIQTRLVYKGELAPKKSEFNYTSVIGPDDFCSDRPTRYSRKEWTTEVICGREPIEPYEGEVPYGLRGEYLRTNKDGQRVAAFIKGNEEELCDHYGGQAIMELMDATIEMEDAEDAGDAEAADAADEKIRQLGFDKPISAGRRGSGKSK